MSIHLVMMFFVISLVGCDLAREEQSSLHIVGGEAVQAGDPIAGMTVSLVKGRVSFCSGVVVAPRFILTAAHCLDSVPTGNFQVYFGLMARPEAIDDKMLVSVEEIKAHESYMLGDVEFDPETGFAVEPVNDIALVELLTDALAPPAHMVPADTTVSAGEFVVLAGFGKTAAVGGTSHELRRVETSFGVELPVSKEVEIQRGPRNSCDGDSGGPLYLKKDDSLSLLGILSRGDEDCEYIGVYTDVRKFHDWITTTSEVMTKTKGKAATPAVPMTPSSGRPMPPPML